MKRLIKFGLVSILSCFGLSCFCSAFKLSNLGSLSATDLSGVSYIMSTNGFWGGTVRLCSRDCSLVQVYFDNNLGKNRYRCLYYSSEGQGLYTYGLTTCDYSLSANPEYDYLCSSSPCTIKGVDILSNFCPTCPECQECQSCPEINTGDILSGSCDINYCVENDLCPVPSNFSQLYINDIEHESAPVINVDIPDEIGFDYTVDSGEFNLQVSGYNVDTEYIEGLINTQNYKPNSQDFNNVITGLVPLVIPGLVIILFIRFIFRFIKKIF